MDIGLAVIGAYLLGSVSFAIVVSEFMRLPDPRSYGSKNPGATNVLRTGRKSAAVLTLFGDAAKGWLAGWLAPRSLPRSPPQRPPPGFPRHPLSAYLPFSRGQR